MDTESMRSVEIVSGGTIVGEHGTFRADVVIRDGRISGLVQDSSALEGERLDATGRYVFPGGVDIHTHLREPSKIEREDFAHGTASAVAGGITTVVEMPQADPLVVDVESLRTKRALAERGSITDFGLHAAAVGQSREELAQRSTLLFVEPRGHAALVLALLHQKLTTKGH